MQPAASEKSRKRTHFGPTKTAILEATSSRGHMPFNLWCHFSPKLNRDVVLRGDAEFLNFLWMEADTNVANYVLEPDASIVEVADDVHKTQFDAAVYLRTGANQLREVKSGDVVPDENDVRAQHQEEAQRIAANKAGFNYVRIGASDLAQHRQLINNSLRMIPYIAAAQDLPLLPFRNEVMLALQRKGNCSIQEILNGTDPKQAPLYLAALFLQIQSHPMRSDLDSQPLTLRTRVWLPEETS